MESLAPASADLRLPTREEAEAAVRVLIRWAGDDPARPGLLGTPERVSRLYRQMYSGYRDDAKVYLATTFDEIDGYDDLVLLRDIPFASHSERDMSPFRGLANIAYLPRGRAVGLSKLARVVDVFAHRLQDQGRLAEEILSAIGDTLDPKGAAVVLEVHRLGSAIAGRRVTGAPTIVSRFSGVFASSPAEQSRVLSLCTRNRE
ncbi:MAG: GTP cyclohydrolase I [Bauldia sp.]|nr:GTP cyclohydrolase I [Bauldia sp.]